MKLRELIEITESCKANGATDESILEFNLDNKTYTTKKIINNEDVINIILEIKK